MQEITELDDKEQLKREWRVFLLECEYSKYYNRTNLLTGGSLVKNPVLEQLLPSLLLIRVVSILDESLKIELKILGIKLPQRSFNNDLHGRIGILGEKRTISTVDELQTLRCRRNHLAHDIDFANWDELSSAVDLVEFTLQELEIVGSRPKLEYFGERSAIKESPDPKVKWIRDFKCGIKENNQVVLEHSWTEKLMNDNV